MKAAIAIALASHRASRGGDPYAAESKHQRVSVWNAELLSMNLATLSRIDSLPLMASLWAVELTGQRSGPEGPAL
jgi:hypothetical protein